MHLTFCVKANKKMKIFCRFHRTSKGEDKRVLTFVLMDAILTVKVAYVLRAVYNRLIISANARKPTK